MRKRDRKKKRLREEDFENSTKHILKPEGDTRDMSKREIENAAASIVVVVLLGRFLAVSSLLLKTLLWHLVPHLEGILILASRLLWFP